jgi:hypothetical protein
MIVVAGRYESDGRERKLVIDEACSDVGIALSMPERFPGDQDLARALASGRPGTRDKNIRATFIGRFEWRPDDLPKRVLILKEIRDVSASAPDQPVSQSEHAVSGEANKNACE